MPCGERLFPLAAVERLNPKLREEFQRYFCCYTIFLLLLELFGQKSKQSKTQHLRQREWKLISNWDSWRLITEKPMHNWFPVRNNIHQFIHDNETRTYVNQKLKLTWFHRQQHKLSAYWRIERQPCLTWCLEQEHPCTPSSPLLHMAGQALLFSNSNWFVRALIISSSWINCIVDQHLIEKWPENVALFLVDFPRNKKPVYMLVKFQNKIGTKTMGTFFIKTSYLFFK